MFSRQLLKQVASLVGGLLYESRDRPEHFDSRMFNRGRLVNWKNYESC